MSKNRRYAPARGTLEHNPGLALVVAAATGAIIASVLPKSRREVALLRPIARQTRKGALTVYAMAKASGMAHLASAGPGVSAALAGLIGTALKGPRDK